MIAKALNLLDNANMDALAPPCILVIDDDTDVQRFLSHVLAERAYDVVVAPDGDEALAHLGRRIPDLIIADVNMPRMGGFELLAHMRAQEETRHIPFLLLSGNTESYFKVAGLDLGANDYITKPVDRAEILARVRCHLRQAAATANLRKATFLDPLTSLLNRRGAEDVLRREVARAIREAKPLTVAYLDVDGFKEINDSYGHKVGDECLREVAQALTGALRACDAAARVGGDEFVVLLPTTTRAAARRVVSRMERAISAIVVDPITMPLRTSIGVASLTEDISSPGGDAVAALLNAADRAMYEDKRARRIAAAPGGRSDQPLPPQGGS